MADGLMKRSAACHHRLNDQTQHQQRQKELAVQGADPVRVTAFHNRSA